MKTKKPKPSSSRASNPHLAATLLLLLLTQIQAQTPAPAISNSTNLILDISDPQIMDYPHHGVNNLSKAVIHTFNSKAHPSVFNFTITASNQEMFYSPMIIIEGQVDLNKPFSPDSLPPKFKQKLEKRSLLNTTFVSQYFSYIGEFSIKGVDYSEPSPPQKMPMLFQVRSEKKITSAEELEQGFSFMNYDRGELVYAFIASPYSITQIPELSFAYKVMVGAILSSLCIIASFFCVPKADGRRVPVYTMMMISVSYLPFTKLVIRAEMVNPLCTRLYSYIPVAVFLLAAAGFQFKARINSRVNWVGFCCLGLHIALTVLLMSQLPNRAQFSLLFIPLSLFYEHLVSSQNSASCLKVWALMVIQSLSMNAILYLEQVSKLPLLLQTADKVFLEVLAGLTLVGFLVTFFRNLKPDTDWKDSRKDEKSVVAERRSKRSLIYINYLKRKAQQEKDLNERRLKLKRKLEQKQEPPTEGRFKLCGGGSKSLEVKSKKRFFGYFDEKVEMKLDGSLIVLDT